MYAHRKLGVILSKLYRFTSARFSRMFKFRFYFPNVYITDEVTLLRHSSVEYLTSRLKINSVVMGEIQTSEIGCLL